MFVWVMGGVTHDCYMTICRRNESLATLETLEDEARFGNSIPAEPLPGNLLLCHTTMMHLCFVSECYSMIVWVMGVVTHDCYMTICRRNESLATLETLKDEARFENSIPAEPLPGKLMLCHTTMMYHQCFRVVQYVILGHGWGNPRLLHDYLPQERVSCHTWHSQRRRGEI